MREWSAEEIFTSQVDQIYHALRCSLYEHTSMSLMHSGKCTSSDIHLQMFVSYSLRHFVNQGDQKCHA